MKKSIALVLLLLMMTTALAEPVFDNIELQRTDNTFTFEQPGTVDMITRLVNQPYMGEVFGNERYEYGDLCVYIDYIRKVDADATLLRLLIGLTVYDSLQATEIALEAGGKRYTFAVDCDQSEYDGIYMEDYAICLTDTSLPLVKALAQQKKDGPIPVTFLRDGSAVLTAQIILPGDDAAAIYDRYIDLGGKKQDLKALDKRWPCKVESVK